MNFPENDTGCFSQLLSILVERYTIEKNTARCKWWRRSRHMLVFFSIIGNTCCCDVIQNGSATNYRAENSNCTMVSANKFGCHSPLLVQKPVQVQGSTSKEYGDDVGGAVWRNWERDRQEKRREQATCSHPRHCWDHSCECGRISNTEVCATAAAADRQHGAYFEPIYARIRTGSMSSSL